MSKRVNELFFTRPWALKESTLMALSEIIERHMRGEKLSFDEIEARTGADKKDPPPGYEVVNSVARIPIYGVISKRSNMIQKISQPLGASVQEIEKNFKAAMDDPSVDKIIFDIDSPGGSTDGVAELSDMIYSCRGKKEMAAFANGQMDSAAYWIGSAADKVYASKSAEVGSIGVYTVVNDFTVANHNAGVKTEVIKAGKYKAAGHPDKHMTEEDKTAIQDEVNAYYSLFTDAVKRNRGMSDEKIAEVANGKVFIGKQGQDNGLVDGILSMESIFPHIQACHDDNKGKTGEEVNKDIVCQSCKKEVKYKKQSNAAVESVECPHCKAALDIEGKVVKSEKTTKQEVQMEGLKDLKLESLKTERPDLVEAIVSAQKATASTEKDTAVQAERARVLGIIDKSKVYSDAKVEDVIRASIENGDDIVAAESKMKDKKLEALQKGSPASPGPEGDQGKNTKSHLDLAKEYATVNKCSMTEALLKTAPARTSKK